MNIANMSFTCRCPACADGVLGPEMVQSALWHRGHLIVIRDIPALVCDSCGERMFGDSTAAALDMMVGDGLQPDGADEIINVPVFAFVPLGAPVVPASGGEVIHLGTH